MIKVSLLWQVGLIANVKLHFFITRDDWEENVYTERTDPVVSAIAIKLYLDNWLIEQARIVRIGFT